MGETTFCCGVPYEGKGSCAICGEPLWKARAKEKAKKKKPVESVIDEIEKEREYKHKLWLESYIFSIEEAKRAMPDRMITCKCCGREKEFRTFQFIIGDTKPQYDFMSPLYDDALFQCYGPFLNHKEILCGNCAHAFSRNLLPRSDRELKRSKQDYKNKYKKRTNPRMTPPTGGVCPKCLQVRSLHHNAWVKTGDDDIPYICRGCRKAQIREEHEKNLKLLRRATDSS